jgi:acyl-CoA thioesterase-2
MTAGSETFTDAVTLKECEAEVFDLAFTATTQPCPWPKAYGGDMVAQALVAASRSVPSPGPGGKTLHSMHSYFMRPAEIGAEVRYEVEVLRDGRGYSTRQVRGYQNDKTLYVCLVGFAAGEDGDTFAADLTEELSSVPGPDDLPSSEEYLRDRSGGTMTEVSRAYWSQGRAFDMRHGS